VTELLQLPPGALWEHALVFAAAVAVAALATWIVRAVAIRVDFVSRPQGERWSHAATPMGGGVALFVTLAPGLYLLSPDLLVSASLVFLLGLIDDKRGVSPPTKLVVQAVAACWVVAAPIASTHAAGALIPAGPIYLAIPITIGWYVGMANSVNLLDNMDGSAAGVAAVAAAFVYVLATGGEAPDPALAAAAAIAGGACVGFLVHNFPPAKIYMGDAGSLLLGFALAGLTVHLPHPDGASAWRWLPVPLFVLGAPLFDTALVWFTRRSAQRPFLQGGRDHTTHRLMALGLSPRRTLSVLYGAAAALGGVGLALARGALGTAVIMLGVGGIALVLAGFFLGEVPVYKADDDGRAPPLHVRSPAMLYAVELLVDVIVLSAAWIGAYSIRFEDADLPFYLTASALPALPFVIAFKLAALLWLDLYRGVWRTIQFRDVVSIAKAISLGSLLVVVTATAVARFEDYSRGVFAIDWLLSLVGVIGSRSALRVFRDTLARLAGRPRKVLLLGSEAVRALLEPHLAKDFHYELVETLTLETTPEALEARIGEDDVEVVLVGAPLPEDDPLLAAIRRARVQLRQVTASLE
jgi:UDP-GlcNAc:undecaprenyl-phosphate GlcNAc-1-phosphate transferase